MEKSDIEDRTATHEHEVQDGKPFAIISYLGFLCIVALLFKRDNRFAIYHAKHGLVLFILEIAGFIVSIVPFLGLTIRTVGFLALVLVCVWGMIQSAMGNYSRIPVISEIADKITL